MGYHLTAYGGRDDGLFRGAIMESGGSISYSPINATGYQSVYDELVANMNCSETEDSLQCLREAPFEQLNAAINGTDGQSRYNFAPMIDGDFITQWGSIHLNNHRFVKVPILAGTNTDEGTSFAPTGIETSAQFYDYLISKPRPRTSVCLEGRTANLAMLIDGQAGFKLPPTVAQHILELYPDDPAEGVPEFLGNSRVPSKGAQWRRAAAYAGDAYMHANRRRQCEAWAENSTAAYCYRFNMRSGNTPSISGAAHFEEVAFVFNNLAGLGYHYGKPFAGMPDSYRQLSQLMARMWVSFIHDLDPNSGITNETTVRWQTYGRDQPVDLMFDANVTSYSYMEPDTWRQEGIDYINSVAKAYWR